MEPKFRFGIFAAVSSDVQAREDKASLSDQIKTARKAGITQGGVESTEPFVLDGYSRTGYINLIDALEDIPPLKYAIESMERDEFDVLIVDNIERFGDLAPMVYTLFRKHNKQIHSARQATPIQDPESYDHHADESSNIMMHVEGIVQTYRINKIRRGWNLGVPERARKGLHPLSIPFGYRTTGKDTPAEQIPEEVELIKSMAAMFLKGKTLQQIAEYANSIRKPRRKAKEWTRTVVKRIILNRFYAGVTIFGRYKTVNKKRIKVPPSQWIIGQGKHVPIYSMELYNALLAESERRDSTRTRVSVHALTGVLACSVCGERLHRHGKIDSPYPVDMSCKQPNAHVYIYYDLAFQLVAKTMVKALRDFHESPPDVDTAGIEKQIQSLEEKRVLVQEGYEAKVYSKAEAGKRIHDIEVEQEKLRSQLEHSTDRRAKDKAIWEFVESHEPEWFEQYMYSDEPTEVNITLTSLCEKIIITPRYEMTVVWR